MNQLALALVAISPQDEPPFTLDVAAVYDATSIVSGGVSETEVGRILVEVSGAFDLGLAFDIDGASIGFDAYLQDGRDGSQFAGDAQAFSNIDTDDVEEIAELYYEQLLLGGEVRLKIGKVDANSEFAFVDGGGEFINSSFGFSPTIGVLPTYPDPATSVNVFWYGDGPYLGVGVFDGAAQEGYPLGRRGPSTFFGAPSDLFTIAEAGLEFRAGLFDGPGRVALGYWMHSGRFQTFAADEVSGTDGLYFVLDQALGGADHAATAFLQLGASDGDVLEIDRHVGAGVSIPAPFGRRADDAGVATTWAMFSSDSGIEDDYEAVLELFYRLQINEYASVKPDLQYIANPGGDPNVDDAIALTLRIELNN